MEFLLAIFLALVIGFVIGWLSKEALDDDYDDVSPA